jgi:hypothetical protein
VQVHKRLWWAYSCPGRGAAPLGGAPQSRDPQELAELFDLAKLCPDYAHIR